MNRPLLIVVSAPSGAGKTTLCDRLLADCPDIVYSVSCTTRVPRGAEQDGEDYHFLTREAFDASVAAGRFLEHATVHGNSYGTLRDTVEGGLAVGKSVLMDIDVQGAHQVRAALNLLPEGHVLRAAMVDIFINPPSLAILKERLIGRAEDSAETIVRRLAAAEAEMAYANTFRHVIVNDDLERAYRELREIVDRERGA